MSSSETAKKVGKPRTRDAARTQKEILDVAVREFADHGFHGARIERITKAAKCNARMIYHYYGGKEQLYLAALDNVFATIRKREATLRFGTGDPVEEARRLVEFTFDYFAENETFLKITRNENLLNGKYIRRSQVVRDMSRPFIEAIGDLMTRGYAEGAFRRKSDPVQLYISIVALSAHHLNNAATLGAVVGHDLSDPEWQAARREHAIDMVLSSLGIKSA